MSDGAAGEASRMSVLFVCMGNICRSPAAEAIFRAALRQTSLGEAVLVDSAGTHDYHLGEPPDQRMQKAAALRGYDLSPLRARVVTPVDLVQFDYVLAMDRANLDHLERMHHPESRGPVRLLLDYSRSRPGGEVPDPYYGGHQGFDLVLDLVQEACEGLLAEVRRKLGQPLGFR